MRTFKFFPGFLPFKAIGGYKGKIIKYWKDEVMVDGSYTRPPLTDFVHLSDCPHFNIFNGPSSPVVYLRQSMTNYHGRIRILSWGERSWCWTSVHLSGRLPPAIENKLVWSIVQILPWAWRKIRPLVYFKLIMLKFRSVFGKWTFTDNRILSTIYGD